MGVSGHRLVAKQSLVEGQMSHRSCAAFVTVVALGGLMPVPASGQRQAPSDTHTTSTWTAPRTPDGRPDLQGLYTTQTLSFAMWSAS